MNTEQLSMLEVAIELLNQKKTPQVITTLIQEVLELKGLDDPNGVLATQLYIDITTSSSFVFCGEGKWDLKTRQSLEMFDRDGSFFNTGEEYEEEEEIALDDYNIDDEDESIDDDDYDDEDEEDDDYYDDYDISLDEIDPTEDDDEVSYLDEQEYNDIMDDYESMYEDN
jgi:DNA-directed RNA polymerase subunit delta